MTSGFVVVVVVVGFVVFVVFVVVFFFVVAVVSPSIFFSAMDLADFEINQTDRSWWRKQEHLNIYDHYRSGKHLYKRYY